jgi:putative ABC transport system permease protein
LELTTLVHSALDALKRNRLRAFLTTLGIIIAVATVIAMIAVGRGAMEKVQNQIASLGTNVLFVMPGATTSGGVRQYGTITKFTYADLLAIEKNCPAVQYVSPQLRQVFQVVAENQNWSTAILGVSPVYFLIRNWNAVRGRLLSEQEVSAGAKVALLGQIVATNLFGSEDPVGKMIRIKNVPFRVIGLLEAKGQSGFGGDQDDSVIVPYTTDMRRIAGLTYFNFLIASATTREQVGAAEEQITQILREEHHIPSHKESDFTVRTQDEFAQAAQQSYSVLMYLLASVAGISLLVGGIGIMNIMLVSVTERTREIGIRMAIGATDRDILLQFLVESVVLSIVGGIIGIVFGTAASILISKFAQWRMVISPGAVILSFAFSALVGIFFGYYPARRASSLNPIDALRYE